METFTVEVRCTLCRGNMRRINDTRKPGHVIAFLECQDCGDKLIVRFTAVRNDPRVFGPEHGTEARHRRHIRDGEQPCPECLKAHNLATQIRKERKKATA
jgi:hypothetical protein